MTKTHVTRIQCTVYSHIMSYIITCLTWYDICHIMFWYNLVFILHLQSDSRQQNCQFTSQFDARFLCLHLLGEAACQARLRHTKHTPVLCESARWIASAIFKLGSTGSTLHVPKHQRSRTAKVGKWGDFFFAPSEAGYDKVDLFATLVMLKPVS